MIRNSFLIDNKEEAFMIIEEITLVGYKRFTEEIKSFHWTPEAPLSIILGTNGSGKSSLLRELNPLPASRDDYYINGYKRVVVFHNHIQYILYSEFHKGQTHSFIQRVDGIETELNESGTITIQKELVEKIFGYTDKIHRLLLGEIKFTTLSPSQRKELLMEISPLELDYSLNLYEKIRSLLRDTQGAIKHQIVKCEDLETRIGNISINEDKSTIKELEETIEKLLPFKGGKELYVGLVENEINFFTDKCKKIINDFKKCKLIPSMPNGITNIEELSNYIGTLEGQLQSNIENVKSLNKQAIELQSILSYDMSKQEIENRLQFFTNKLKEFNEEYYYLDHFENIEQKLLYMKDMVESCFPTEIVYTFTEEEILDFNSKYEIEYTNRVKIKEKLDRVLDKLKHIEEEKGVLCPKCKLQLSINGTDLNEEKKRLIESINKGNTILEGHDKIIESLLPKKEQISTYIQIKDKLVSIKNQERTLYKFWEQYPSVDMIIKNLPAFVNSVLYHINYVYRCKEYYSIKRDINEYTTALQQYDRFEQLSFNNPTELEKQINNKISIQYSLKSEIGKCKKWKEQYQYYYSLVEEMDNAQNQLEKLSKEWIDAVIQEDVKQRVDSIYSRLGTIKHLVQQKETLQYTLSEVQKDIKELTENEKSYTVLLNAISPNKGIIADQMIAFLNSYIEQINGVVNEVWEHELEIQKFRFTDEKSLDYKFPLLKEGSPIPDIKECSGGQQEIINLAFILIMREYLKLQNYPMYLDETGRELDELHRNKLMKFIKQLIDSQKCNQIFMINHYVNWYGGLSNYETVVLDKRNIVIPSNYNQTVIINEM